MTLVPGRARHRFAFLTSARLIGWLPVAGAAAGVALLLILNASVWRGSKDTWLPTARVVETIVPLAVGLHAAFLLSPEDERPLELLLTLPRPLSCVLGERTLVMAGLQGGVALIGSLAALALSGQEDVFLATARWLPPSIFIGGVALLLAQLTRKGTFSALVTVILWGGMLLGGDALLKQAFFLRPVHPYLQPGDVPLADYARNRLSLTLAGGASAALAFYLTYGEERLLGVRGAKRADRRAYLWLALAGALLLFSLGGRVVPLAAWLAPVLMMRFVRRQTLDSPGAFLSHVVMAGVIYVSFERKGVLMFRLGYYVLALFYGLYFLLPFLADRLVAPRIDGFASTLVFPLAWVTLEYGHALLSPMATLSLAYAHWTELPLVQIAAVTGMYGVTFLVTWFAPVVNWAWERGFAWPRIRGGVCIYAGVLGSVLLLGGARLALWPPDSPTVRVASVTAADPQAYLERSAREAQAGARIVLWPEAAVSLPQAQEHAFVDRGRDVARRESVYLAMALASIPPDFPARLAENKSVLVDPSGEVAWEYLKSIPVPGLEASRPGDGRLPALDTPYGRVSTAICYDLEFPALVRQAGRAGVDLLLAPANAMSEDAGEEPGSLEAQSREAVLRAVENGVSVVHANGSGGSLAVDYQGRVLAAMDTRTAADPVMVAQVPTEGVTPLYARIGDAFAWLCVAALAGLTWLAIARRRAAYHAARSTAEPARGGGGPCA